MAEIEVKGQRSCEIWQSLKNDVNAHGFVIIIRRKLVFGRVTEVYKGIRCKHKTFSKCFLMVVPWFWTNIKN